MALDKLSQTASYKGNVLFIESLERKTVDILDTTTCEWKTVLLPTILIMHKYASTGLVYIKKIFYLQHRSQCIAGQNIVSPQW